MVAKEMVEGINHFLIDPPLGIWEGSCDVFKYLNYLFGYLKSITGISSVGGIFPGLAVSMDF